MTYDKLKQHIGHEIVVVGYALKNFRTGDRVTPYQSVSVECDTCNEVLISYDKPKKSKKHK